MNLNALTRNYDSLTAEERFRLIVAAGDRGDKSEQQRLLTGARRITITCAETSPFGQAFFELSKLILLDLLDHAGSYMEAFEIANENADEEMNYLEEQEGEGAEAETSDGDANLSPSDRAWHATLALGFMLKTKANGWKVFCERMTISPFMTWKGMPGFERLQRALRMAENAAFGHEGFQRWVNRSRPTGSPEGKIVFTAEGMADAIESLFRKRVKWWSGG